MNLRQRAKEGSLVSALIDVPYDETAVTLLKRLGLELSGYR